MTVPHRADWWLGDLSSPESLLMEACIAEVWGVQDVLRIREGGSIPSIPFLEKEFSAQVRRGWEAEGVRASEQEK
jgi:di- and tripeptidase